MSLMNCIKNNKQTQVISRMHYLMDTFFRIEVFAKEDKGEEIVELAFNEAKRIERLLSRFREDSQVHRLNIFAYYLGPQKVDIELIGLIRDCLEFSKKTRGAFDITVVPLMELWDNCERKESLPTEQEIKSLLNSTGYKNIVLDDNAETVAFKTPLTRIDFGSVGKGYALDRVIEILKDNGIEKARLDFGGHLYCFDQLDLEEEYIGIKNPICPEEIIFSLPVINKSISTSANYERNFNIGGKSYSHIINPASGYPSDNGILSVSVICVSATLSDMLSTAVFVMGLEEGMRLIEDTNGQETIIITTNNGKTELHSSQKLKEVVSN